MKDFQEKVGKWAISVFGETMANSIKERVYRFIEEALELAQSLSITKDKIIGLVNYVYSRKAGEPYQELGGVMITLAALCEATRMNMIDDAETEYKRIIKPDIIKKIQAKQVTKYLEGITDNIHKFSDEPEYKYIPIADTIIGVGNSSNIDKDQTIDCTSSTGEILKSNIIDILDFNYNYNWDFIISKRDYIKQLANKLNVNQDFLTTQITFIKAITNSDKILAISSINKSIIRLNELTNIKI